MREIRTLRATWRGLETWCESGLPGRTGAPALDPTCERLVVKSHRPTHPAWRNNVSGIVKGPLPFFWGVSKTA